LKTEFWLISSAFIALALIIVLPPLWRKTEVQESDVDQQNIDIARQKLADLKAQLQAGAIDQAQYDEQFAELERALSFDLALSNKTQQTDKQMGRWMTWVVLLALPVVTVLLYQIFGNPSGLFYKKAHESIKSQSAQQQQVGSIASMVSGLAERLQKQPDDVQGWLMLGKSYKYLKQFDKAVDAFAKANVLAGDDPDVMLQYADALVMINGGSFVDPAKQLIFKALEIAPQNTTALWLGGMAKAQNGEYAAALNYWQTLEGMLEPGSKAYNELQNLKNNVQAQMDKSSTEPINLALDGGNQDNGALETAAASLRAKLKDDPNDQQSWILLGKTYKALKQYDLAISAFKKADVISGNQSDAMLLYADALVMNAKGFYSDGAKALIFKALSLDPENVTGLWLAAKAKIQDGALTEGLSYLHKAEAKLPPGSNSLKTLRSYIAKLESQAPDIAKPTAPSQAVTGSGITVSVSLSDALKATAGANDTLFVYAKAMSGPQMPLAIVRKQVKDLPLQVVLTDAQAMTPMMKLSKFPRVKVLARVSKSGNAMPQPGDLVGSAGNVAVAGQQPVSIMIDRVFPSHQAVTSGGITVSVSLSDALKATAGANDTLFVYAKAMSGPQMPLAIVRKQVKDLPLQVVLTDAQAMTPMMKLSKFPRVKVLARVSKSGNAMPQPGDLVGSVNNVKVAEQQPVSIKIEKRVQ